jgi:hypothetical protein
MTQNSASLSIDRPATLSSGGNADAKAVPEIERPAATVALLPPSGRAAPSQAGARRPPRERVAGCASRC